MAARARVRAVLGGPLAKRVGPMDLPPLLLKELGRCIIRSIVEEAKKDFVKRGWSLGAADGKLPLDKSFRVHIRGDSTIEILSSFPMLQQMVATGIPKHPMSWMTQEAKDKNPGAYELSPKEEQLGMRKLGRVSKGERLPLVVPMTDGGTGTVVFRVAPLKLGDAWIHPGVAKFTFLQRGIAKGKQACAERIRKELIRQAAG